MTTEKIQATDTKFNLYSNRSAIDFTVGFEEFLDLIDYYDAESICGSNGDIWTAVYRDDITLWFFCDME